jgi:hypothetical protein
MSASFKSYLKAGYPALWVNTLEPARAEQVLGKIALEVGDDPGPPLHWDIGQGLVNLATGVVTACPSPVEALKQAAKAPDGSLMFLHNFHRLMGGLEVLQTVLNIVPTLKEKGNCIVVLAPSSEKLPEELARVFTTLDFELPTRDELQQVMTKIGEPYQVAPPAEPNGLVDAALGLTDLEAEDAFALALVETGRFDSAVVAREKAGALLRQSQLQMSQFQERFADLGGLQVMKDYTLRTAPSPLSLGIMILGVPGTGKSAFSKALGKELGLPTLSLDFSRMMSSLVGSSEANIRNALKAVDAMGRVVLFLDEIEKGLAGVGSSGELDSGVKAGVGATFLTWLSDRDPGRAYLVATCNNIKQLPPPYQRAERWDAVFFVDLPNRTEKDAIWAIHQAKFNVVYARPDDTDWTGAEIKSCCRTAAMMGCSLQEAARYVIPIARSMKEEIQALRDWASGRAIPASLPEEQPTAGRRLTLGR